MTKTRADLFAMLRDLQIETETVEHEAVFTMDALEALDRRLPGEGAKTLLVQEEKGGPLVLLVLRGAVRLDVKALKGAVGAQRRFSFAKPDVLLDVLATTPGSVSPFALINATPPRPQTVLLDAGLLTVERLHVHPLENTASTTIAPHDLVRFIRAAGFAPQAYDPQTHQVSPLS